GDQTNTNRSEPTPVKGLSDAIAVTAGDDHTCALHQTGEVSCWKDNPFGSVGLGRPSGSPPPQRGRERTKVQWPRDIIAIAAGDRHTCAVHQSGEVSCWGSLSGAYTQSDGTTTSRDMPSPVLGLSDVIALDVGGAHTCAVRQGGTVACWGTNSE